MSLTLSLNRFIPLALGCVSLVVFASHAPAQFTGDEPAAFKVQGNEIHMKGTIFGSGPNSTLQRLRWVASSNPSARTLVLHLVPGTMDDDGAMSLYRFVRQQRFNTIVPQDGVVASGGVDLLCAGVRRTVQPGGRVLVHPWEDNQLGPGDQVSLSNPIHQQYTRYYREMGIADGFYRHTLFAPRSNIRIPFPDGSIMTFPDFHQMTQADLIRFRVTNDAGLNPSPAPFPDPVPPVQPPGGTLTLEQILGDWTFSSEGQMTRVTLQQNGRMTYRRGALSSTGTFSLQGNRLLLTLGPSTTELILNGANQNQIRFADMKVWTRSSIEPGPPVTVNTNINGTWTEIRNDGRRKTMTIANGRFVERSGFSQFSGAVFINDDTLTLTDSEGSETFLFDFETPNKVIFMDPTTQRMEDFYWIRQ